MEQPRGSYRRGSYRDQAAALPQAIQHSLLHSLRPPAATAAPKPQALDDRSGERAHDAHDGTGEQRRGAPVASGPGAAALAAVAELGAARGELAAPMSPSLHGEGARRTATVAELAAAKRELATLTASIKAHEGGGRSAAKPRR